MGKIFGMLFIVAAIWVGLEVTSHGVGGAFGGLFAGFAGEPQAAEPAPSTMDRARSSVQRSYQDHEERTRRLLGE